MPAKKTSMPILKAKKNISYNKKKTEEEKIENVRDDSLYIDTAEDTEAIEKDVLDVENSVYENARAEHESITSQVIDSHEHITVPNDIKDFLEIENCDDFNFERYFVCEDVMDILRQIIGLRDTVEMMREYGIGYLNSTLLYGPPGTGKTTAARYIAAKLHIDFAYINFANLIDGAMGATSRNLSKVFRFMGDKNALFMLDEIDCIAVSRGSGGDGMSKELQRVTISLMQEMDYLKKLNSRLILLGATNRKDILDEALLSRFAVKHEIGQVNVWERQKYIKQYLKNCGIFCDVQEICRYTNENPRVTLRGTESDLIRGIANWVQDKSQPFTLKHYK